MLPLFLFKQTLKNGYKQKPQEKLLHMYDAMIHVTSKRFNVNEVIKLFKKYGIKDIKIVRFDESGFTIRGKKVI